MTKEEYLNKRTELYNQANNLISEGKVDEANNLMDQMKELDTSFENEARAMANLNALKDQTIVPTIADNTALFGAVGTQITTENAEDVAHMQEIAFAKVLMGGVEDLSDKELAAFTDVQNAVAVKGNEIVVPMTTSKKIWSEIVESHPILADLEPTYIPGDITIIKADENSDDEAEVDEATVGKDLNIATGALIVLRGIEYSRTATLSFKIKKMGIEDFLAYVQKKIAEKMSNALAAAVYKGKGAVEGKATQQIGATTNLPESQIVTVADATKVDYDTLVDMVSKVKSAYLGKAVIYARNSTIWNVLAKIKDANKRPLFIPDLVNNSGVGRILSFVVKPDEVVGENEIFFGNLKDGYAENINLNMTIMTEDHIKTRMTDYVGYMIADGDRVTDKAFAMIKWSNPAA